MTKPRSCILGCLALLIPATCAEAGVIFNVSDATFISDGVTETSGIVPVELVVTTDADAVPGDTVLSWDLEALDVTEITGSLSNVSLDSFEEGDLFDTFLSVLNGSSSAPHTFAGSAVMAAMAPFEPVLRDGATFFLIHFSVPAGETGSFDIVLDGADGQGLFGVFNSNTPNGYSNVSVSNGTITVSTVPEPSMVALVLMGFGITRLLRLPRNPLA